MKMALKNMCTHTHIYKYNFLVLSLVISLCILLLMHWKYNKHLFSEVARSCLTLCYPMYYDLPGSSVCGILQIRILEWVAISFSRVSSWPRDWTQVSCIAGRRFTLWATREALSDYREVLNLKILKILLFPIFTKEIPMVRHIMIPLNDLPFVYDQMFSG